MGRGCLSLQPSRYSGEHREFPQRGAGQSPGRKTSFGAFIARKNASDCHKFDIFDIYVAHIQSHSQLLITYICPCYTAKTVVNIVFHSALGA